MSQRIWIQIFALSSREDFVCRGLAEGLSYKEIAGVLDLSTPTVKTLAQRAMDKFGVGDHRSLAQGYRLANELARMSSVGVHSVAATTRTGGHPSG